MNALRWFAVAIVLACPLVASAAPTIGGIASTGVGLPGVLLPGGATDSHWTYGYSGNLAMPASMNSSASVIPTLPSGWVANTPTSQWIKPAGNNAAAGYYFYQTTFDLTGTNANNFKLSFHMTGDDEIACVLVNDWITPYSASNVPGNPVHGRWSDLIVIDNDDRPGQATFLAGLNTLTFVVRNDDCYDTGLQVRILSGAIAPAASTPEPMTLAVFGALSVIGVVGARRLRKS